MLFCNRVALQQCLKVAYRTKATLATEMKQVAKTICKSCFIFGERVALGAACVQQTFNGTRHHTTIWQLLLP